MERRLAASLGTVSFWLGMTSAVLAFMPMTVAFYFQTTGFSDRALESALSFMVPALMALAAVTLGVTQLARHKRSHRLAALGIAFSIVALAGCALTINGFQQVFGQ